MVSARIVCVATGVAVRGFRVADIEDPLAVGGEEASELALLEEAAELDSDEEMNETSEGYCVSPKFPTYYSFAQADPNAADYAAVWLDIEAHEAKLTALPSMHWVASFESPAKRFGSEIHWDANAQDGQDRDKVLAEGVRINLHQDVKMVKRVRTKLIPKDNNGKEVSNRMYDPEAAALEIHYKNGEVDIFSGGVYYKNSIVQTSMLFASFQKADSGVQTAHWADVKYHLLSETDPKKIEEHAKFKCLGYSWCAGFQYNPANEVCTEKCQPWGKCVFHCNPTQVFYLREWGAGPVGRSSPTLGGLSACPKAHWPNSGKCRGYAQTPLSSWVSYRFRPRSSKGVVLQANLSAWRVNTKVLNAYNKKKAEYEQKYTGMSVPMMAHTMDQDSVGDRVSGTGRIAQAVKRIVNPRSLLELSGEAPRTCEDDFPSAKLMLDENAATLRMVGIDATSIKSCSDARRYCSSQYIGQPMKQYCPVTCKSCSVVMSDRLSEGDTVKVVDEMSPYWGQTSVIAEDDHGNRPYKLELSKGMWFTAEQLERVASDAAPESTPRPFSSPVYARTPPPTRAPPRPVAPGERTTAAPNFEKEAPQVGDVQVLVPNPALFAKTMSYREAGTLGSEKLFKHLRCVRGFKACGRDLLVPKADECPEA